MQLEGPRIAAELSRAAFTLYTGGAAAQVEPTRFDFGVLTFYEPDRVSGVEVLAEVRTPLDQETYLNYGFNFDSVTGATPNGASPSTEVQTFTNASGFKRYQTAAGETPTTRFNDNRIAVSLGREEIIDRLSDWRIDAAASLEFDYQSAGLSTRYSRETNQRNTTFELAFGAEVGRVHPVGGIPIALAAMLPAGLPQPRETAARTRYRQDLLLSLTQVLDRRSLLQVSLGTGRERGYLTDPYRLVSRVDALTGSTIDYRFESRPDERDSRYLYLRLKRHYSSGILDLGLRESRDNWEIEATTLELRYRIGRDAALGEWVPFLRWHRQSAAEFYRHSLPSDLPLTGFVSADDRLAGFDAVSLGLGRSLPAGAGRQWYWQVALYQVDGSSYPDDAIGLQRNLNLFPVRRTLMLELSRNGDW